MTIAARVIKPGRGNKAARQVQFPELSEPACSRFDSSAFEPLSLPTVCASRFESTAERRFDSALTALRSTAGQLHAQRDQWLDQSQHEAVRLGIAIAEHLLRRTLDVQPAAILDLIRSALDWSVSADRLRVRVHPADAELVASASETRPFDANHEIEFLPDASLKRGDCVIESSNGQTDARLDVILQRIADELLAE